MAVLKDGLPARCFLVVPDPQKTSTWALPVLDADGSANHTKMGAAWAALHEGYRGNTYEGPAKAKALARLKALYRREKMPLPDSQMAEDGATVDLGDVATFALGEEDVGGDEEMVVRSGLIFKAGDYRPKRDFAITPEELSAVAATFNDDLPNELEHFQSQGYKTFLDGRLGQLVAIWTSEDGAELFGDVEVPRWLDRLWAEAGRKVSTVWDTTADGARRLVRLGLCLNPVVQEAALFAEYAAFAGQRHSAGDLRDLQTIHDLAVQQGAACPDPPATSPMFSDPEGQITMPDEKKPDAQPTTPDPALVTMQTQFAEMQGAFAEMKTAFEGQITDLKSKNEELAGQNKTLMANYATERTKRLQSEAVAFADAQIAAGKAFPYEREGIATDYLIAVEDDAQRGPIQFAEGEPPVSRVERLQKLYATKPAHKLTAEQMRLTGNDGETPRPPSLFALPNLQKTPAASDADAPSAEGLATLMNMTDLGRRAAAAQNGT